MGTWVVKDLLKKGSFMIHGRVTKFRHCSQFLYGEKCE